MISAELTGLLQFAASIATLIAIIILAISANRTQKQLAEVATSVQRGFIKREEAFRVKPILAFSNPYFATKSLEQTAEVNVKNVGRGDAVDIELQIAPTKDYSEEHGGSSRSAKLERLGWKDEDDTHFDTQQQMKELKEDIDGYLQIWGTMKDEEGNVLRIKAKLRNREYVMQLPEELRDSTPK